MSTKQLDIFNNGVVIDKWPCDVNPINQEVESNGGQEFVVQDSTGQCHLFICTWDDVPVLYSGLLDYEKDEANYEY